MMKKLVVTMVPPMMPAALAAILAPFLHRLLELMLELMLLMVLFQLLQVPMMPRLGNHRPQQQSSHDKNHSAHSKYLHDSVAIIHRPPESSGSSQTWRHLNIDTARQA
jgi:hypothetical protein